MIVAASSFSQEENQEHNILTAKGKWYLYKYSQKFKCSDPITVEYHPGGKLEGNLSIHTSKCTSNLSKDMLEEFVLAIYNYGTPQVLFDKIWVNDTLSWNCTFPEVKRPDTLRFLHFKFIAVSDSSFNIFENGKLILEDFKDRYLENCIYKSDTLEVIRTKLIGKNDWIIKTPCEPFFFSKTSNKNTMHNKENWTVYTIKCDYPNKTTTRTIALNRSNNSFRWIWDVGRSAKQITSGYYELVRDSLLVLNSDPILHEEFLSYFNEKSKSRQGIPRYIINRSFLLKEDEIYYINPYR